MLVQERGGKVLGNVVHAGVVPHGIAVVLGRNEVQAGHGSPGFLGRGNGRGGVVVGVLKGEQVARCVDAAFKQIAHAGRVASYVVHTAGHEEHRCFDASQTGGVPKAGVKAPGGNGNGGFDAFVHGRGMRGRAGLACGQCATGRAPGVAHAGGGYAGAYRVERAVATHGVAEQGGVVGVDQAFEGAGGVVAVEARHFIEHKQLVE